MLPINTSTARQPVRPGCYTCKVRKVRCKSEAQESSSDGLSSCASCRRLGLECRWSAPVAGEHYSPPPKRRQTIDRRRERSRYIKPTELKGGDNEVSRVSGGERSTGYAATSPVVDVPRLTEQGNAANANHTSSLELDACVDMLGDLPFELEYGLDFTPVDLNLHHGTTLLDHRPLSLSAGGLADPTNLTDSFPSPHSLELQSTATQLYPDKQSTNGDGFFPWDISNIGAEEQHLIQHYLMTMTGYAKVDDGPRGASNLYTTAFSQSLSFKPLLYAILAFSASHLALEDRTYAVKASHFEQLAHDSFEVCKQHNISEPESLLSALFVRAKRVHLLAGDVEVFHALVNEAVHITMSERGQRALQNLYSLAQRIVIRLAILDARASCYRLGGGKLIQSLRHIPAMSFIFERESDAGPTASSNHGNSNQNHALVSLLRADLLRMKIAELDLRLRHQAGSATLTPSPVSTEEVRSLHGQVVHEILHWEQQMRNKDHDLDEADWLRTARREDAGIMDASAYAQYLVLAALHAGVLYLYLLYPLRCIRWEHSVSRILHCHLKFQHDPSRRDCPSSLAPSSFLLAGICTTDLIHRDWVLDRFRRGERWGTFIQKARQVLEAATARGCDDDGVDICTLMDRLQGRFFI
ncbi:uncharacterized protein BO95DRAFT_403085 [Aspergillus brunneoviolaceus CBS 621.78]|uniref:Uncharacterized protein n=1 Tax=Aspergillus brunneoviolaceus CBS 621.78 TaxID=1450534 RepID=A0ACD1GQ23_9EURO|nr:hypothetical protein BO95DRAFT_403085 [Aspergillus brunneoviolaceus CBS 621.78]RAH51166.1 hypothetical protein BO95DRAFT_403085 [Aspergillus brunneoviolaceus CBS 621.78]